MSQLHMHFAAPIHRVEFKNVGGKALAEISIFKKNRAKRGEEATFTWLRISVWDPKDWQTSKMIKGAMIAGHGDFQLRSYESKGEKKVSAEISCTSFDIEVSGESAPSAEQPAPAPIAAAPIRPAPALPEDDENLPPF